MKNGNELNRRNSIDFAIERRGMEKAYIKWVIITISQSAVVVDVIQCRSSAQAFHSFVSHQRHIWYAVWTCGRGEGTEAPFHDPTLFANGRPPHLSHTTVILFKHLPFCRDIRIYYAKPNAMTLTATHRPNQPTKQRKIYDRRDFSNEPFGCGGCRYVCLPSVPSIAWAPRGDVLRCACMQPNITSRCITFVCGARFSIHNMFVDVPWAQCMSRCPRQRANIHGL